MRGRWMAILDVAILGSDSAYDCAGMVDGEGTMKYPKWVVGFWSNSSESGSCNSCQTRDDHRVIVIETRMLTMRLCPECADMLRGIIKNMTESPKQSKTATTEVNHGAKGQK